MKDNNEFIPLYTDLMIKKFLGTNEYIYLTTYLLETLLNLPKGSLDGSIITNSVKLDKETIKNKGFESDIVLKTPKGEIFDIEMQTIYNENAEIKNVMYISKIFSEELNIGETYDQVKPVTLINLVKNLKIHKTDEIIKKYVLTNVNYPSDKMLEDYFTIYIIDIDSKSKLSYNNNKEFDIIRRFIGSDTLEKMKNIINESNGLISPKLLKEMINFMNDKEVQDYNRKEKLIRSNLKTAKEEGLAEGKLEVAKMLLLNTETPLEQISLCTNISLEELQKLQKEIN